MKHLYFALLVCTAAGLWSGTATASATGNSSRQEETDSLGVTPKRNWGHLSGSFETNTIYYRDDTKTGAKAPEDNYGSNNYLKLDYRLRRFSAGIQAEWYPQVLQGDENKLDGFGLPEKYLAWTDRHWSITLGDFYEQFGSGLVLRAWEDRALGFNNSLGGGRVTFDIGEVLQGKALFGFPRYYMEGFDSYSSTQVAAGDLSLSLSNALGWKEHSFALEGSLVNRHESGHPADYTEEVLGFALPRNVLSWSARAAYEHRGWMLRFEYVGKGKDLLTSPLTQEFEFKRGSAQLAEVGYSGNGLSLTAMFRRLDNMQDLMYRTENNALAGNILNYVPALAPQHTYLLSTLEPYRPNVFGEIGGQIDLFYLFRKGSAIGGRRGLKVHGNFSMYYTLDGATGKPGNHFLYRDFTCDLDKSWNRRLRTVLFVSLQKFANHAGDPEKTLSQNVFVGDITYKFTRKFSVRAELQYLYTPDGPDGDWVAGLLELNIAPKWSIWGSDMYNYGGTEINYYSVGASFTHSFVRVALSWGRNREGYICSGGVCRQMPAYTGGNLQMTLTF